jgi:hypothetical protein
MTTRPATHITAYTAVLNGTVNSEGQQLNCGFYFGTSPKKITDFGIANIWVHGTSPQSISAQTAAELSPGTKYYYQSECFPSLGTGLGNIESFTTARGTQTIDFQQHVTSFRYGIGPVTLRATSSSGLPVELHVNSGPARIDHATNQLIVEGAGEIVVEAFQPGDDAYFAAEPVKHTWEVKKVLLTVTATNETMKQGSAVQLFFHMTGFVNAIRDTLRPGTLRHSRPRRPRNRRPASTRSIFRRAARHPRATISNS